MVILQDPLSSNAVSFTGQGAVTLTGVVYAPDALVKISGQANVTINPGAGTAVSPPPILGALIAFDLKVDGNGVLTINPDDPPGATPALAGGAASSTLFAPDPYAAALNALVSEGGARGSAAFTDQEAMAQVVMSLAGTSDMGNGFFNHTKKKG
jgi:hypothetical protein